ncbi:MAG TPA: hypothetical protein VKV23_00105, partial [Acidimicrobiales bacterium]|nr:hypothetical protein [Acidimicrobiales bacterium]
VSSSSQTLSGFTSFTAGGTYAVAFTTSDTTSATFTGNAQAGTTITLSGSGSLVLSGLGSGTFGATTFSAIGGISGSATVTVTLDFASSLSFSGTTGTLTAGSGNETLSGFTSFTAGGTYAVAFATDGSAATFTGNDTGATTNSTLAVSGSFPLVLSGIGSGSYGSTSFSAIKGTISGPSAVDVELPASGTVSLTVTSGSVSFAVGSASQALSGFTVFTAEASGTTFTSDATAGYTFNGAAGGTTLSYAGIPSGGSALTACLSTGTVYFGSATCGSPAAHDTFTAISKLVGGGGTNSVVLPTGSGTLTVTVTSSGVGVNGILLVGFPSLVAPATGTTNFVTDGSAPYSFTGNSTTTTLTVSGTPSGTVAINPDGSGSITIGSVVSTFASIPSLTGSSGLAVSLPTPPSGSTLQVVVSGTTVSVSTALGLSLHGFTTFTAATTSTPGLTTAFVADATPGYSFNGAPSGAMATTLSFGGIPSGGAGICAELGSGAVYFGATCSGAHDSFSAITTITGSPNPDTFVVAAGNWTLAGGGGDDTVDFSAAPNPLTVNVDAGTVSGGFSGATSYTVTLSGIASVIGSATAPNTLYGSATLPGVLVGGAANDTFYLRGGPTVVNGGGGSNTVNLSETTSAVWLDLTDPSFQYTGGAGEVLVEPGTVQNVVGSPFGSTILGATGSGTITGEATQPGSSDLLSAGSGSYVLDDAASTQPATLVAGSGTVTMDGGLGATTYVPGSGSLTIVTQSGPAVSGTLSFAGAPAGVEVNLSSTPMQGSVEGISYDVPAQYASGGWGAAVSLSGISSVIGTAFDDVLIGTNGATLDGGAGSDLLIANGTGVTVKSEGSAVIVTGSGSNSVICSPGSDCTVDYSGMGPGLGSDGSQYGVAVNLGPPGSPAPSGYPTLTGGLALKCGAWSPPGVTTTCSGSWTGTDTLVGVSRVVGTTSNDVLVAGAADQTLVGGGGADLLVTSAAGYDTLEAGGSYQTTFKAEQGTHNTLVGQDAAQNFFLAQLSNGQPADDTIVGGNSPSDVAYVDPSDTLSDMNSGAKIYYASG